MQAVDWNKLPSASFSHCISKSLLGGRNKKVKGELFEILMHRQGWVAKPRKECLSYCVLLPHHTALHLPTQKSGGGKSHISLVATHPRPMWWNHVEDPVGKEAIPQVCMPHTCCINECNVDDPVFLEVPTDELILVLDKGGNEDLFLTCGKTVCDYWLAESFYMLYGDLLVD